MELPIDRKTKSIRALLRVLKPGTLLDLGCGHGMYSIFAQSLGWDVTAVDARPERMPKTEGITWVVSDVRHFEIQPHTCICIFGLFYHLTFEDQIDLLRRCAHSPVIIDTHYALTPDIVKSYAGREYKGKIFHEARFADTEEKFAKVLTAAWKNRQSFWPDERSLVQMLQDFGGYEVIFKSLLSITDDRGWWLCLPKRY